MAPMLEKLKNDTLRVCRAFASPINTLLAQVIIASLLFTIGIVAAARAGIGASIEQGQPPFVLAGR